MATYRDVVQKNVAIWVSTNRGRALVEDIGQPGSRTPFNDERISGYPIDMGRLLSRQSRMLAGRHRDENDGWLNVSFNRARRAVRGFLGQLVMTGRTRHTTHGSYLQLRYQGAVGLIVDEYRKVGAVGRTQLYDPTGSVWIAVHEFGLVVERCVDGDYFARYR